VRDLLEHLYVTLGINARIDMMACRRFGVIAGNPDVLTGVYDKVILFPIARGLTAADVLTEVVAQSTDTWGYRIRGNQVLIGPAFIPPTVPGGAEGQSIPISTNTLVEQLVGEPDPPAPVAPAPAAGRSRPAPGFPPAFDAGRSSPYHFPDAPRLVPR